MILLTGATGTAGSFIASEFVRGRVPVRIMVRNRAKAAELEKSQPLKLSRAICLDPAPWERFSTASTAFS